ncbi:stage III sporulation protein AA [Chakrabartyella piscis]|uniref:stage III sporulation protein AA n=1 Tax=Chakrabartyella piscis TaxID=2918914 RepID=UPI002958B73A|nr:stage III sporulation protein AA [Chakrabartyella piscis]
MIEFLKTYIPNSIWDAIERDSRFTKDEVQEVRLRIHKPIAIKYNKKQYFLNHDDVTPKEMSEIVAKLSQYSLYAFAEELGQGYLTLAGGHRVGFCGKAVYRNGQMDGLRQISSINIRIAKEIQGCGTQWIPYLFDEDQLCHVILVSPPACGKTTLLRDLIRLLSNGVDDSGGYTIGIVDERGELSATEDGIPQLDVGLCTDVQGNCPKPKGMQLLLHSMSPNIIAVDELGKAEDYAGAMTMLYAGVVLMATIHGDSYDSILKNPYAKSLVASMERVRIFILSQENSVGTVEEIWNQSGECIYQRKVI